MRDQKVNYLEDRLISASSKTKERDYWLKQLSGQPVRSSFTFDSAKGTPAKAVVNYERSKISGNHFAMLTKLSKGSDYTLYLVLLSNLVLLVHKYTGLKDIMVGAPIFKQQRGGNYLNTVLPLRHHIHGDLTFKQLLLQTRQTLQGAVEHQNYPMEALLHQLGLEENGDGFPLFDIAALLENIHDREYLKDIVLNMVFSFLKSAQHIEIVLEYNANIYDRNTIAGILCHFVRLLSSALTRIQLPVHSLEILSRQEKQRLLMDINDSREDFPRDRTVVDIIEDQSKKKPNDTALQFERQCVTYRQLTGNILGLAAKIREKSIKPDQPVGILLDRSPLMVESILAAWHAGRAYIPISPGYPPGRVRLILEDSQASVLLTDSTTLFSTGKEPGEPPHTPWVILVDESHEELNNIPCTNTGSACTPSSLAYIIFTSGSTGKPKGVMVDQTGMMNHIQAKINDLDITWKSIIAQNASHTFDISVWQFFAALLRGGKTVIYPNEIVLEPGKFIDRVMQNKVTLLEVVPSYLSVMLDSLEPDSRPFHSLEYLLVTGEEVKPGQVERWFVLYPGIKMVNAYGPTEASDDITHYIMDKPPESARIPIGKPIQNFAIFILDQYMNLCPAGVSGEICVSGVGVGRGYLNNPELTHERFVNYKLQNTRPLSINKAGAETNPNHKLQIPNKTAMQPCSHAISFPISPTPHSPIYLTGDLGRRLPDGNIEFLGRIDQQVKLRGFRIEPGEIEARLMEHPGISEAVVVIKKGKRGNQYLCAYLVAREELSIPAIQEYLFANLPPYMVPDYFVELNELPLTPNGKIDRKLLVDDDIKVIEQYTPPSDEIQEKLAGIWSDLLGIGKDTVSIDANFFELGGNSLNATVLISKIHRVFNVKVPLLQVFKTPGIKGLAQYIKNAVKDRYTPVTPAEKREYYILSPAQKRLYILQQMEPDATAYNMPEFNYIEETIDIEKWQLIFKTLIHRHESLKTGIEIIDGTPVQRVHDEVQFEIEYDLSLVNGHRSLVTCQGRGEVSSPINIEKIIRDFVRPFDLSKAPLLRVGLIELLHTPSALRVHPSQEGKAGKYLLLVDMHHIISDGVSHGILVRDFLRLFGRKELPPLRVQYKDYAKWQSCQPKEAVKKQEEYWLEQFPGEIPVLSLPLDYSRPAIQSFEGAVLSFEVPGQLTRSINQMALDTGATLYMVLLSTYNVFLSKLSGHEDIVVGTPTAGRRHVELQGIIGMFVNTLAMRNFPIGDKKFIDFLLELKERTLEVFENQEYQFEDLVDKVSVNRDTSRNPIFDTMFALQNMETRTNDIPAANSSQLKIKPYEIEHRTAKFDLTLTAVEIEDRMVFTFEYCTGLFKKETIRRFIGFFKKVVSTVLENYETRISEIEIISEEEKNLILLDFNDTAAEYPLDKTIHQLFTDQVERIPHRIAVIGSQVQTAVQFNNSKHSNISITYKELNGKSNQLACLLKQKGVGDDTIVGIMVERSIEMIIGILGILKAGGAYLPIDPAYPQERIDYMLKDSGAKILVTVTGLSEKFEKLSVVNCQLLMVNEIQLNRRRLNNPRQEANSINNYQFTIHNSQLNSSSLAYAIYTSGSTGNPKGTLIQHRSLMNRLNWMQEFYPLGKGDVILQKTTYTFDVSVWELLWWGIAGAGVYLLKPGDEKDPRAIVREIHRQCITAIHFVPSMLKSFLNYVSDSNIGVLHCKTLRQVFSSGEALSTSLVKQFYRWSYKENGIHLINLYGPTEAAIDVSYFNCTSIEAAGETPKTIPIGKPIDNTCLYILDRNMGFQPMGLKGELFIGGIGLARGYLNKPDLTFEKFKRAVISHSSLVIGKKSLVISHSSLVIGKKSLVNSHSSLVNNKLPIITNDSSHKLSTNDQPPNDQCPMTNDCSSQSPITPLPHFLIYRSGDLARWLQDGNIEFLGRIDHQVKIRGFRVELGEIESQMLKHPAIKEVVVMPGADETGDKYLCAYIVPDGEPQTSELREYLSLALPDYMIPSYFVLLEKVPLTSAGKIDRAALPTPGIKTGENYAPPRDLVEKALVELWSELLAIEKNMISIDANFFELGGQSLKATIMIAKVHKNFQVKLPLAEVFKILTIKGLAAYIKNSRKDKYAAVEAVEKREYYTLTSSQKRLYILQQMDLQSTAYNMPEVIHLDNREQGTGMKKFAGAFKKLIRCHESLRTSFHMIEKEPVQQVHDDVEFVIEYEETKGKIESEAVAGHFIRPFDLSCGPLLRVEMIKTGDFEYLLIVDMHHIISDGVSHQVLVRDFMTLYSGEELVSLRIQYKDFSGWQQRSEIRESIKRQEDYWLKEFLGEIPVLNLLTDYPRPAVQSSEGSTVNFEISPDDTRQLKTLAFSGGSTLYMVLLSIFNILLSKLSGQEDIVIGTPIAGRRHADLEKIIGIFVNTLTMRNYPIGEKKFIDFLLEIKERTLDSFENQEYQFEDLVEKVSVYRDASRNPLFDTMFALEDMAARANDIPAANSSQLKIKPYEIEHRTAKFDLTLNCFETEEKLFCSFEYCTQLFKKETIERFINYFKQILQAVLENRHQKIFRIEIITAKEKRRILHDFNDTAASYPNNKTLHQLFAEQVKRTPDNIALVEPKLQNTNYKKNSAMRVNYDAFGGGHLSYRELNEKSHQLARVLIEKGVKPDTIVGIMVERSLEMIVGILGILKAGSAYLPIDPDYPEERINYMLSDSGVKVMLTDNTSRNFNCQLSIVNCQLLMNNEMSNNRRRLNNTQKEASPHLHLQPAPFTCLAYIIYTSGSMGRPKGVLVAHRSVVNLICNQDKYFNLKQSDRILQFSSICFDASVEQIFIALTSGASLLIIHKDVILNQEEFETFISTQLVTHIDAVPSFLNHIRLKPYSHLKRMISGGDFCPVGLAKKWCQFCHFYNAYGPTETTVTSSIILVKQVTENTMVLPIGKPIGNTRVYMLDKWMMPVPLGVTGELYIGGEGVARGYLNQPELTAEKFDRYLWNYLDYQDKKYMSLEGTRGLAPLSDKNHLQPCSHTTMPSPHYPITQLHHFLIYRTGDLARWLSDGNIEFLGRIDRQVKIRGYRIELSEIEYRLQEVQGIKQACVIDRERKSGEKYLCAYFVTEEPVNPLDTRNTLSKMLPDYMVPVQFIPIERIPLTPNGKVDKRALLAVPPDAVITSYFIAPKSNTEKIIAQIWKEVLELDKVGVTDNFFEIGGTSLDVIRVTNRMKETLNRDIPMFHIFHYPNISKLAEYFDREESDNCFPGDERLDVVERGKAHRIRRLQKKRGDN